MIKKIKNLIKRISTFFLYRDKKVFYDSFLGSVDFKHLFFWNFVKPGRILTRIRYNRFLFPKKIDKNDSNIYVESSSLSDEEITNIAAEKLNKHGVVVLKNYFSEQKIKNFEKAYSSFFNQINEKEISNSDVLPISNSLVEFWLDKKIINIIKKYIKRLPYARNYPMIVSKKPNTTSPEKGFLADDWHLDHSTLIQSAIYFSDVEENGSHMEVLRGTHRFPCVAAAGTMSKEYVDKKKLPIAKCIGDRGTVQIHCGNVFHRLKVSPNSRRTWVKFEFTSGNNILLNSQKISEMLANKFDLLNLDNKSQTILSSIFPRYLNKGYEIKDNVLSPTKYKGV